MEFLISEISNLKIYDNIFTRMISEIQTELLADRDKSKNWRFFSQQNSKQSDFGLFVKMKFYHCNSKFITILKGT